MHSANNLSKEKLFGAVQSFLFSSVQWCSGAALLGWPGRGWGLGLGGLDWGSSALAVVLVLLQAAVETSTGVGDRAG